MLNIFNMDDNGNFFYRVHGGNPHGSVISFTTYKWSKSVMIGEGVFVSHFTASSITDRKNIIYEEVLL